MGIVVSLFRLAIEWIGEKVAAVYRHLADHPDQIILWVILSIITAIIVILLVKSEPQIKGSGIPQVEGKVKWRDRL